MAPEPFNPTAALDRLEEALNKARQEREALSKSREAAAAEFAPSAPTIAVPVAYPSLSSDDLYGQPALSTPGTAGSGLGISIPAMARRLMGRWYWVALGGLLGAGLAAAYSMTLPDEYAPVARLVLEPRGLQVLPDSVAPRGLNNEATIAYSQSQVDIIRSSSVLDRVIDGEDLVNDPEFAGSDSILKRVGLDDLHFQLFGLDRMRDPGEARAEVLEEVRERLYVGRLNQSFVIELAFQSRSPAKAARVTNAIARSYLLQTAGVQNEAARSANQDLTARLAELRAKVASSEQLIEAHKKAFNLVETNGRLVDEDRLARLNEQLSNAVALTAEARSRVVLAREIDVDDVIGGGLPAALSSGTVAQLRVTYAQAKSRLDRLAVKLGERHRQRRGATAELASAETAIREELTRLVAASEREFTRAQSREKDLAEQVAKLRAATLDNNGAKAKLRELERQLDADRRVYETVLQRSRETGEQTEIARPDARIITEALPPQQKQGPQRRLIAMGGGLVGGGLAAFLILLPMFWRAGRDFATAPAKPSANAVPLAVPMLARAPETDGTGKGEPRKRRARRRRKKVDAPSIDAATARNEAAEADAETTRREATEREKALAAEREALAAERAALQKQREDAEAAFAERERQREEAEAALAAREREAAEARDAERLEAQRRLEEQAREEARKQEAKQRAAREATERAAEAEREAAFAALQAEREAAEAARIEAERQATAQAQAETRAAAEARARAEERLREREAELEALQHEATRRAEIAQRTEEEMRARVEAWQREQAELARAEREQAEREAALRKQAQRLAEEREHAERLAAERAEIERLRIAAMRPPATPLPPSTGAPFAPQHPTGAYDAVHAGYGVPPYEPRPAYPPAPVRPAQPSRSPAFPEPAVWPAADPAHGYGAPAYRAPTQPYGDHGAPAYPYPPTSPAPRTGER